MSVKGRPVLAGLMMILVASLGACSASDGDRAHSGGKGGGNSGGYARPQSDQVRGLYDAVRHLPRKTAKGTRPHLVKECDPATRKVRHTSRSGAGKRKRTRTWYTTERYERCRKVRKGSERYTRIVRPERWCVRLDDVNGKPRKDDRWFRVSPATYSEVHGKAEHARVKFEPRGRGC
ncbi:hypothetical protein EOT10_02945 [Streptomyces antnestii]|uniref:Lipoprotein n=1 Tax=Streptomyces antnestii TaxID=2494256 RepID=A0A3S2VLF1_9ACTN|nr:hypothetical protein [Streptomyces sp. San01]RVU28837.1 hypothetical protein EOT10_02945 [Streptomyces sp. San01]